MDIYNKLTENTLFRGMSPEEIKDNLEEVEYRVLKYSKDETVAFRGDEIKGLYINLGGELVAEMMKASGEVKKIEDIEGNQIIASAFIFGGKNNFPVDLVCKSTCKLFFISKEELLTLISRDKRILANILDEVSNKAQFLSMKVWSSFSNKTIPEKLVNYILKNKMEERITFKPSLKEVANLFSVARPSLSRVISEFVDEGILEKIEGRNTYRIVDMDLLREKVE
ncbi:Crp/Fnr family transcriptional regulator [Propionigenium maris DSM 9537]|uniref:Crp/Fnr family transcriptional regulator n=1 Tax=Propionigenium maris DSM 9537 TaxID=1123000 RepID=A0A9W6LPN8_9FUSO|nr:Crp/Fnr family transcriptional regulator [Propionigenium maris]GLI58234.1 Crp/Fnr family transcriptional regulator [Propionigenium maris DSM 9537]